MKKMIAVSLVLAMALSMSACGKSDNDVTKPDTSKPVVNTEKVEVQEENKELTQEMETPAEQTEIKSEPEVHESLVRLEEAFKGKDRKYDLLESLQGKYNEIVTCYYGVTVLADHKLYSIDIDPVDFPINVDGVITGGVALGYGEGKLAGIIHTGDLLFTDVPFNPDTDYPQTDPYYTGSFYIMTPSEDGTKLTYRKYARENSDEEYKLIEECEVTGVAFAEDKDIIEGKIAKFIIKEDKEHYNYCLYAQMENGDLYYMKDLHNGKFIANESIHFLNGADKVYARVTPVGTTAVYSIAGHEEAVYTLNPGRLSSTEDDFVVKINLPDGYKPSDIKQIIDCTENALFVFNDGGAYFTETMLDTELTEYNMTKNDELTAICSKTDFYRIEFGQPNRDDALVFLVDGYMYYYSLEQ